MAGAQAQVQAYGISGLYLSRSHAQAMAPADGRDGNHQIAFLKGPFHAFFGAVGLCGQAAEGKRKEEGDSAGAAKSSKKAM